VGPVLRSGVAASLSFVVARSLLLLQLIKRIALMALEAITNLLQRWLDRLASSGTPSDELDETDESS
jgi:hypothetical protein